MGEKRYLQCDDDRRAHTLAEENVRGAIANGGLKTDTNGTTPGQCDSHAEGGHGCTQDASKRKAPVTALRVNMGE